MNERMWKNPVTGQNIEKIKKLGALVCGPAKGRLACGDEGMGRMSEPDEIMAQIVKTAENIG
jgi:phosphopantothenoylcysteine decarboxylase/phosphopantothenate--cysteine ligase